MSTPQNTTPHDVPPEHARQEHARPEHDDEVRATDPAPPQVPPPPGAAGRPVAPTLPSTPPLTAPRQRSLWLPVVGAAAGAALLASVVTLGATGVLGAEGAPAAADPATIGSSESTTVPVSGSTAGQPDWRAVAEAVRGSVVAIDVRTAAGSGKGSGVVLDTEGRILTNDHVVGDAVPDGLRVTLADGRVFGASIVGTDPTTDLAVIALDDPPSDLQPGVLGASDGLAVGTPVMAVGNPLGLDSTVTTGIVSALDRPVSTSDGGDRTVVTNAIQIDAAINPGNSGGPLFDARGEVIGITSSIASLPTVGGSAGSIGLGFAIPVDLAERVAAELIDDGSAEHAFLGVTLSDGEATFDGTTRRGAVVEEVVADSPAGRAGLEAGDVVVAIGDDPVNGAESLTAFVRERAAGSEATLTVVRGDRAVDVDVTFAQLGQSTPGSRFDRG